MIATLALLCLSATAPAVDGRLVRAAREAIADEIDHGISATKARNMDQYMDGVPDDYRIVEDDGSITDKAALRRKQEQAWALIPRTNALTIAITRFSLGCEGTCAQVETDQRWDRQMIGRDGITEFNVVTTQRHTEDWALRGSRWTQVGITELGGTTMVDGKPY